MSTLPTGFYIFGFGLFGIVFGSFLNAVIYRVPNKISLNGRSSCPKCEGMIKAYDNIPVLSWLILRGKCRSCKEKISMRYPLIELANCLIWIFLYLRIGLHPILFLLLVMSSVSLVLTLIDFDTLTLPDVIVMPSWLIVGVSLIAISYSTHSWHSLKSASIAAVYWGLFYFALWFFYPGGGGIGFGDVKLAPLLGALVGWFSLPASYIGIFSVFIVGGVLAIVLLALKKVDRKTKIPYGPIMIIGAWIGIVWGVTLSHLYLHLLGLRS